MSNNYTFIRGGNSTNTAKFNDINTTAIALLMCIGLFGICSCYCLYIEKIRKKKIQPATT